MKICSVTLPIVLSFIEYLYKILERSPNTYVNGMNTGYIFRKYLKGPFIQPLIIGTRLIGHKSSTQIK